MTLVTSQYANKSDGIEKGYMFKPRLAALHRKRPQSSVLLLFPVCLDRIFLVELNFWTFASFMK